MCSCHVACKNSFEDETKTENYAMSFHDITSLRLDEPFLLVNAMSLKLQIYATSFKSLI